MDKFLNSTKVIILLTVILLCLSATACVKPKIKTDQPKLKTDQPKKQTVVDTLGNLPSIANVLGCVFAPETCEAKKELGKTEEGK